MGKAEEKSEQYRAFREQCGIKDPIMLNEIEEACYEGYLQAEKDLALTYKDVARIFVIATKLTVENTTPMTDKEFYQEILKRFNEMKANEKE